MKTFLLKIAGFGLVQGLLAAALLGRYDVSSETNFLAATAMKHRRLAQISPPRLMITGGSNVPFGIQSDRMEQALGRPVVNMGLAAGLGLDFMLAELQSSLRQGDTVLISLEYDQFSGGFDPDIVQQVLVFRPASLRFLRLKHFRRVLLDRGLPLVGAIVRRAVVGWDPSRLFAVTQRTPPTAYGYNLWGDLRAHYGKPPLLTSGALEQLLPPRKQWPHPDAVVALTHFADFCHRQGVALLFSFPPQQRERLNTDRDAVDRIFSSLQSIPHLTVLDSPDQQCYPATLFYDTGYHLNEQGAELRTQRLIEHIRSRSVP